MLTESRQPHGRKTVNIFWNLSSLLLALAVTAGCGVTYSQWSFQRALLEVDALADRGQHEEARERYLALAHNAQAQVDLQYLQYRAAYMLEQMGDAPAALKEYERIYTRPTHPYDDYAGRSLYRSGVVYKRILGDDAKAREIFAATVLAFPDSMFAEEALTELQKHALKTGTELEFMEWMADKYTQIRDREIADNFVYVTGKILHDELGRCDDAMELYNTLVYQFAGSSFVDDAIWRVALCHRENGRIDEEYRVLNDFVTAREFSVLVGDYNYSQYNPSHRRLAAIHEERGEIEAAIREWRRFQRVFPLSLDADDVQYHIITLYDQLGNLEQMRKYARELEKNWPESRYIPRARALVEAAEARQ